MHARTYIHYITYKHTYIHIHYIPTYSEMERQTDIGKETDKI